MTFDRPADGVHPAPGAPLLSVIIPALEMDRELRRCVDSVLLCLDAGLCEVLVVMPAAQVPAAERELHGVRVLAEGRRGVYAAMNDGVAASRGRYLYFVGKDDVVLPAFRELVPMLQAGSPRIVLAQVYWRDDGVHSCAISRWRILFTNVCQQGIVYARESVVAHGPYVRRLKVQADHLLNIRVLWDRRDPRPVLTFGKPLAWYAARGLSYQRLDRLFHKVHPAIIARYLGPWAACLWRAYKRVRPEAADPR